MLLATLLPVRCFAAQQDAQQNRHLKGSCVVLVLLPLLVRGTAAARRLARRCKGQRGLVVVPVWEGGGLPGAKWKVGEEEEEEEEQEERQ